MTLLQREAYDWAAGGLSAQTFVDRYGTSPTVRHVVLGESAQFLDAKRREVSGIELARPGKSHDVSEDKRPDALMTDRAPQIVARVEGTELTDRSVNGQAGRVAIGGGVVLRLFYRLDGLDEVTPTSVPCAVRYRLGPAASQRLWGFDCAAARRGLDNTFEVVIPLESVAKASEVEASILIGGRDNAGGQSPASTIGSSAGMGGSMEQRRLREIRRDMRQVLGYLSSM